MGGITKVKKLTLITATGAFLFCFQTMASNQCVPSSAIVCTIAVDTSRGLNEIAVATTFQRVASFSYYVTVDDCNTPKSKCSVVQRAKRLAQSLKSAGVCNYVVDDTLN